MAQDIRQYTLFVEKRKVELSDLQLKDLIRDGVREGREGMRSWVDTYVPEVVSPNASTMLGSYPHGLFMIKKNGEEKAKKIFDFLAYHDYSIHLWNTDQQSVRPHSCTCPTTATARCAFSRLNALRNNSMLQQTVPMVVSANTSNRVPPSLHLPYRPPVHRTPQQTIISQESRVPLGLSLPQTPTCSNIFVKNIQHSATAEDLHSHFQYAGDIAEVTMHTRHNQPQEYNGTATIRFRRPMHAEKAIGMFHNQPFLGRPLHICWDDPSRHRAHPTVRKRRNQVSLHQSFHSGQPPITPHQAPPSSSRRTPRHRPAHVDTMATPSVSTLASDISSSWSYQFNKPPPSPWSVDSGVSLNRGGIALDNTEDLDDDDEGSLDNHYEQERATRDGPVIVDGSR